MCFLDGQLNRTQTTQYSFLAVIQHGIDPFFLVAIRRYLDHAASVGTDVAGDFD
jgi:hypothetical protein